MVGMEQLGIRCLFYNGGMRFLGMCYVEDGKTWDGPTWDELSHFCVCVNEESKVLSYIEKST